MNTRTLLYRLTPLGISLGFMLYYRKPGSETIPFALTGAFVLFACFLLLYPWCASARQRSRVFALQKELQGLWEIELTAEGLVSNRPAPATSLQWKNQLRSYRVGPNTIILYGTTPKFLILPKPWFAEEQLAEFQSYLRTTLGKPKA